MPGGVPLRPLTVGDILSGAFTLIRRNPVATLGLAAIVEGVAAIATPFLSLGEQKPDPSLPEPAQSRPAPGA